MAYILHVLGFVANLRSDCVGSVTYMLLFCYACARRELGVGRGREPGQPRGDRPEITGRLLTFRVRAGGVPREPLGRCAAALRAHNGAGFPSGG